MEKVKPFGIDFENDNYAENTVYGMAAVFSLIEKEVEEILKPYNLSTAKFNALMIIKHQGGDDGLSQVEIGKKLIVTASNMTKLLDRLTKENLIIREAQKGDRRVNIIKITQKGSELLDEAWPSYLQKIKELTGLLENQELKQISEILGKWFEKLNKN
ncbi:MAG: MarR family transcriptional regulator [bacterium]